jgi:mRNA interferase MazF
MGGTHFPGVGSIMVEGLNVFPKRGDIYKIDFDPRRGSEQGGKRPGVIISSNRANRLMPVVTVAAITTTIRQENSPISLILPEGQPLPEKSCVMAF